jgi:hypothetical protein
MSGYPRARSEGIATEEVGDELVVYVQPTQTAHALSKDAAGVWRLCDGEGSPQDIARRLGLEEARVFQALDELWAAGLIEEPEGISRRALYRRAAQVGAAALGAPLIYSVAVHPSSAHASVPGCTGPGCPGSTSVSLNGTCAKPCTGPTDCTSSTGCFGHLGGGTYCGGAPVPPVSGSFCFSDTNCPAGSFCDVGNVCISATC